MADIIQIRRDNAATWASVNPILAQGEFGVELDTGRAKIGNGVDDWNTLPYAFNIGIAASAGAQSILNGTLVFSNSNGVTFGLNGSTLTASVSPPAVTQYVFSNSNNVSFGTVGSTVTATASLSQSLQPGIAGIVASNTVFTSGDVYFRDGNGVSWATTTGQSISITHGLQYTSNTSNITSAAFHTSNSSLLQHTSATSAITSNALNTSQSSLFRHTSADSQLQFTSAMSDFLGTTYTTHTHSNLGLTLGDFFDGTFTTNNLSFDNTNIGQIEFHLSTDGGGATLWGGDPFALTSQSNQALSGSNGSFSFQTATFGNLNGASFYTSNGSMVLSYTVPSAEVMTFGDFFDGTFTTNNISLDNANIGQFELHFSTDGGGATLWGADLFALTSQSNQALSGSNGSFTFQTATFGNANGFSFLTSNGSMVGSYTVPTQTNQTVGIYGSSQTTGSASSESYDARSLSIIGAGIVSVGNHSTTAGGTTSGIIISATQSNQAFSAGAASSAFQTLVFQDSNGVSFSNNAGSIRLTHDLQYTSNTSAITSNAAGTGVTTAGGAGVSATLNSSGLSISIPSWLTTAAQSTQTNAFSLGGNTGTTNSSILSAGGYVIAGGSGVTLSQSNNSLSWHVATTWAPSNHSHGNPTLALTNLTGTTASASNGFTLSLSAADPGAAAENNWHHLLGANTAGNTTASGSTIGLSGVNITLSGTNNSVINVVGPVVKTFSGWAPYDNKEYTFSTNGQGSIVIDPNDFPNVQFDRVALPLFYSNATNASGTNTLTFRVGLYTRNVSSLSILLSTSATVAVTRSGTVGDYSLFSGHRLFTIPLAGTLTEGKYWMAIQSSNGTAGTSGGSFSQVLLTQLGSNFLGHFGSSHNTSYQFTLGRGAQSITSAALPDAIPFSSIRGSDAVLHRSPVFMLVYSTV